VHGYGERFGNFNLTVEEIEIASSDECDTAIAIPSDGGSFLGTTDGASVDEYLSLCESLGSGPGVWYEIVGTGSNYLTASTCHAFTDDEAVNVTIFTGQCDGLECVDSIITPCGTHASVTWPSVNNEQYYVFIQGATEQARRELRSAPEGAFFLSVEETALNDACQSAIGPILPDGSPSFGSTRSATIDDLVCGDERVAAGRGIWYTVIGTGEQLTASTCSKFTNLVTQVSVYEGGCEGLQCVEGINDSCGDQSLFRWASVEGQLYHILVSGAGLEEFGNFVLTIGASNDLCVSAIGPLPTDASVTMGTTIGATVDDVPPCGTIISSPGVWYFVYGTGGKMTATTCCRETDFETEISLYRGSCGFLQCIFDDIDFNDCGLRSAVTWSSVEGELYSILIHGVGVGDFGLYVSLENGSCPSAKDILPDDPEEIGSTVGMPLSNASACGVDEDVLGAWYAVAGSGSHVIVFGRCFDVPIQVSVFLGDCGGDLSCVAITETEPELCFENIFLRFDTDLGDRYLIFVHSTDSVSAGGFSLSVQEEDNDSCENAIGPYQVDEDVVFIEGSTSDSFTSEGGDQCGSATDFGGGVWYSVYGTGERLTATTCHLDTDFDTQISVFVGVCGNGNSTCVTGNDDFGESEGSADFCDLPSEAAGTTSTVSWSSEEGFVYWIQVHGFAGSFGNFTLVIETSVV
jgi:hypothetical protein